MRGQQESTNSLFSFISTKDLIPETQPLGSFADQTLDELNSTSYKVYHEAGAPLSPVNLIDARAATVTNRPKASVSFAFSATS